MPACPRLPAGRCRSAAGGQFADGTSSFAGTFGYGQPKGLYGKAALGTTSYDGLDGSSLDLGATGGYQVALKTAKPAEFCPVASLSIGSGPNDVAGTGIDMSSRTFSFGAAVGAVLSQTRRCRSCPTRASSSPTPASRWTTAPTSASGSESYGLLTLGTGFVFNSRYSLNPSINIPVGLDGSSTSFGLAGAMNFGR